MTDKLEQTIRKGQRARLILEDTEIDAIFSAIGAELMEISYKAITLEKREEARSDLRALDRIKASLDGLVANGREAERELERLQTP